MSQQGVIKRYKLIIDRVDGALSSPSFSDIQDYLYENGFEISKRTIQRDIRDIRNEFGLEITYHSNTNSYSIDWENSVNPRNFYKFLEIVTTVEVLKEEMKADMSSINYLEFEANGMLKGVEFLAPLLSAVKNHHQVKLVYQSFTAEAPREYKIIPYLLKEYQNRWYLIAEKLPSGGLRSFGVDRIVSFSVLPEKKKTKLSSKVKNLFSSVIGINYEDSQPELVKIRLSSLQAKYIETLPLHASQKLEEQPEGDYLLTLYVVPNYELKQRILMLGTQAKVEAPEWFVDSIKEDLKRIMEWYEG